MSWFSKNYEKVALGGTVAIALGLAYMGWSKLGAVDDDFSGGLKGGGNSNTAVVNADLIPKALSSLKLDRSLTQADVDGRAVDLFTGIPLFVSSKAPEDPVDPRSGDPIHPPIPNMWWFENRLDPGYGDSPSRDPDQDGFTNLEEFTGKTDPNSAKSYPPLITKLMYVKDVSLVWVLRPGFDAGGGSFPFNYEDNKSQSNKTGAESIAPNGMFFTKAPMANRFKLLGSEVRTEVNRATNSPKEVTIVRVEDQRPNKKGTIYEIPSPLSAERKNEHLHYDRSAVLSLQALGLGSKETTIEENTSFGLPLGSDKKDYLLKKVTPESVEIEYTDSAGNKKPITINKGSLPQIAP